jgi:uncharacterized protein YbcV (DUF1398 family)
MESENYKIIRNFITDSEKKEIIEWINSFNVEQSVTNSHIKEVSKNLNGNSYMFDISKTTETKYITNFQSSNNVLEIDIPEVIIKISKKISDATNIPNKNILFQVIDMDSGGKINPHYDSTIDGFINYKCNISILSEDYDFFIEKDVLNINEGDLYCFPASLYKHWSNEFKRRRILLSFGFILTYDELNKKDNDPRIRLSKRIVKYFQN